jgi:hypothetical protein
LIARWRSRIAAGAQHQHVLDGSPRQYAHHVAAIGCAGAEVVNRSGRSRGQLGRTFGSCGRAIRRKSVFGLSRTQRRGPDSAEGDAPADLTGL